MEVKLCVRHVVPNMQLSFFLNIMLFAMLSFMYTSFLCVFLTCLCSTLLNNVKVETDEIYFIVSF